MTTVDRLGAILDYLRHYFPDQVYHVNFRRHGDVWQFSVLGDASSSSNVTRPILWCAVEGRDFDLLPNLLLLKVKDRVAKYIDDATAEIDKRRKALEEARNELGRRLLVDEAFTNIIPQE